MSGKECAGKLSLAMSQTSMPSVYVTTYYAQELKAVLAPNNCCDVHLARAGIAPYLPLKLDHLLICDMVLCFGFFPVLPKW